MDLFRSLCEGWSFAPIDENGDTGKVNAARVPGSIYLDLARSGDIADPRFGDNARLIDDVARRDWLYHLSFSLTEDELARPADRVELEFDGLDGFAEIRLNGEFIGDNDSLFLPWKAEVGHALREDNRLEVLFRSTERKAEERAAAAGLDPGLPRSRAAVTRTMPLAWGWGPFPALPGCGIWRPCGLRWARTARIVDVWPRVASLSAERAQVCARIEIESFRPGRAAVSAQLRLGDESAARAEETVVLPEGTNVVELRLDVDSPQWWSPNGRGRPALYDLDVVAAHEDGTTARFHRTVGLRTVEWEAAAGVPAGRLRVNGESFFALGATWLPADLFPARCDEPRAIAALERLAAAGANTARVWGGGLFESDAFYDACDRLGLLVWQEFPFPDGGPAEWGRVSLARLDVELRGQIVRLRSHPSLALWRGGARPEGSADQALAGETVFRSIIPQALSELDPDRPYLPGPREPGRVESRWTPGWGLPGEGGRQAPRLVSEIGLLSLPSAKTIKRHLAVDDRQINSHTLSNLCEGGAEEGIPRIARYVAHYYALPTRFDDWIYKSQLAQAEYCREAIETLRVASGECEGALLWAWMDPFFGVTRQAVDCHGRPKALAYTAARFFAPVAPIFRRREDERGRPVPDEVEALVVNDRPTPVEGELVLEHWGLDGRLKGTKTFAVRVEADSAALATVFHPSRMKPNARTDLLAARVVEDGRGLSEALWLFTRPRFLQFPRVEATLDVKAVGPRDFAIRLQTPQVALGAALDTASIEDVEFDDNFFHLLPERPKIVRARTAEPVDAETFRRDLEFRSLATGV